MTARVVLSTLTHLGTCATAGALVGSIIDGGHGTSGWVVALAWSLMAWASNVRADWWRESSKGWERIARDGFRWSVSRLRSVQDPAHKLDDAKMEDR